MARREFGLGDVDIHFSSSCVNLCNGLPARITESAWEHISPYIGCATVQVSGPRVVEDQPPRGEPSSLTGGVHLSTRSDVPRNDQSDNDEAGRHAGTKRKLPLDTDGGDDNEQSDHGPGDRLSASAREAVRDEKEPSDREDDHDGASAPESQREDEQVGAVPPRKSRRVMSESEDDESERERDVSATSQPSAASPKSGEISSHCLHYFIDLFHQAKKSKRRDLATIVPSQTRSQLNLHTNRASYSRSCIVHHPLNDL